MFSEVQHTGTCGSDLRRLAELIAAGKLALQVSWERAGEAVQALIDRRVNGKAVLTVAP